MISAPATGTTTAQTQMIARRRNQRGAPAAEKKQIGEQADEPEQRQRHECADHTDHLARSEIGITRRVVVKSPNSSSSCGFLACAAASGIFVLLFLFTNVFPPIF